MAESSEGLVRVMLGEEEVEIPEALLEDKELFRSVLSVESWEHLLGEGERETLYSMLPKCPSTDPGDTLRDVLSSEGEVFFGTNPVDRLWEKLASGSLSRDVVEADSQRKRLLLQQFKIGQANYYVSLLQELLVSRQLLLQKALFAGSLENMWKEATPAGGGVKEAGKGGREEGRQVEKEYKKALQEMREECEGYEGGVSDEDMEEEEEEEEEAVITEAEYRQILRQHRKRRRGNEVSYLSEMEHLFAQAAAIGRGRSGVGVGSSGGGGGSGSFGTTDTGQPTGRKSRYHHHHHHTTDEYPLGSSNPALTSSSSSSTSSRHHKVPRVEQEVGMARKEASGGRRGRRTIRERSQHEGTTAAQAKAIYEVYTPIDNGVVKDLPITPITLDKPLPEGRYKSFFSLLKAVFEPLNDRKGEVAKLSKNLTQFMKSQECADCTWLSQRSDWVDHTLSALCYLSAEVGAMSSFSPLPHFVPLIEFRDRVDHWKWIGTGRDSELELLVLHNHWLENLDQALPVVDYSDYEPPPPHVLTSRSFQRSTPEEVARFRLMERERYVSPHKSYVYNIRGYESPVGPVKGVKVTKRESSSKARGHALLVPDRPNCITILSLVRDATSRLPNGEGTRLDVCIQVQDSQYIAESVSETQLNNAVSGALDRLHYEKDPCVRYDGTRKVWIYLHRGRNEEDFERIHWACEVAAKQRKMLMSRPRIRPKIVLRQEDGREEVLEPGSGQLAEEGGVVAATRGVSKRSSSAKLVAGNSQALSSGGVPGGELLLATPTTPQQLPQPGQLSLVVANMVQQVGSGVGGGGGGEVGGALTAGQQRKGLLREKKSKGGVVLETQSSDQHPHKRKQSLKVLHDEALKPRHAPSGGSGGGGMEDPSPFQSTPSPSGSTSSSSGSGSSSWSSDSEDSPRLPPGGVVGAGGVEGLGESEWPAEDVGSNGSD